MTGDLISKTLALMAMLGNLSDIPYDDMMMYDEKLMSYSISLVGEIDDLIEEGYTKEEITEIIMKNDFRINHPELTKEEAEFLRKDALRILNIRYRIHMEEKDEGIIKKRLVLDDDLC